MSSSDFEKFCEERIRCFRRDKICELISEKVTVKEILKAYNRWVATSAAKKLDLRVLEAFCDEKFGDSRGTGVYRGLRVFLDEEDLEEFDKQYPREYEKAIERIEELQYKLNLAEERLATIRAKILAVVNPPS